MLIEKEFGIGSGEYRKRPQTDDPAAAKQPKAKKEKIEKPAAVSAQ